MNFNSNVTVSPHLGTNTSTNQVTNMSSLSKPNVPHNLSLNSPMIDRVHKAKPGCSACGKKVA